MPGERGQPGVPGHSLIFPVYNPGPALAVSWRRIEEFFLAGDGRWEIVFVCDGCTDGAPENLVRWTGPYGDRMQVVRYQPNRGKGYAVYQGLTAARGQWRLFTDIDLAYDFEDIQVLARKLQGGAEAVVASRFHPDSRTCQSVRLQGYIYRRHLQSKFFSFLVHRLLPLSVQDTQAGLKGFSARVLEQILPLVRCQGFEFDCELLVACAWLGIPVVEMPVSVRYEGASSTTSLAGVLHMLRGLWRIRQDWTKRPRPATARAEEEPGLPLAS